MKIIRRLYRRWESYWFSDESVIGISLYRIFFGVGVLIYHIPRFFHLDILYTDAGFMWPMQPIAWMPVSIISPLSLGWAYTLNSILLLAGLCFVFGYRTRLSAFLIFGIHTYLVLLENLSTNSISNFISIFSLLFIFSYAGEYFSLDAKHKYGSMTPDSVLKKASTVRKIMLWQIALIYVGNALMKLAYGFKVWITGDVIMWALKDIQWSQGWIHTLVPYIETPLRILVVIGFILFLFVGIGLLVSMVRPYAIVFWIGWEWCTTLFTTISPGWFAWMSAFIILINPQLIEDTWNQIKNKLVSRFQLVFGCMFFICFFGAVVYGRF